MSAPITRRTFLRGAGGALVALPLLQTLPARAQVQGFPKRLVIFYTPNGTNPETWFPAEGSTEHDFTLGRVLNPLRAHQQRLIVARGINLRSAEQGPGEPHQKGMGAVLTGTHLQEGNFVGGDGSLAGWGDGQSIDQFLADQIGRDTRIPSLELGVRIHGSEVRHRMNYRGPATPLPPEQRPALAWARLFAEQNQDVGQLDRLTRERRSVLDVVMRQFERTRRKVAPEDRQKLDAHALMVRDIERRLQAPQPGERCVVGPQPPVLNPDDENLMAQHTDLQIDLAIAALACDQTRIATLQMSSGANNIRFPHLNSHQDDHQLSHAGPGAADEKEEWAMRQTWYATKFLRLLDGLAAIPEGDATLLDHCLILWTSELAQGSTHSHDNMPFLLAGSAGGAIRTGRYLDFRGANHNGLLISIAHAFGQNVETFGDPRYCNGALPGLVG